MIAHTLVWQVIKEGVFHQMVLVTGMTIMMLLGGNVNVVLVVEVYQK